MTLRTRTSCGRTAVTSSIPSWKPSPASSLRVRSSGRNTCATIRSTAPTGSCCATSTSTCGCSAGRATTTPASTTTTSRRARWRSPRAACARTGWCWDARSTSRSPRRRGGQHVQLHRLRHPPRAARGGGAGGHDPRLLAAAGADGQLHGRAERPAAPPPGHLRGRAPRARSLRGDPRSMAGARRRDALGSRSMGLAVTGPLRREVARALPSRPFGCVLGRQRLPATEERRGAGADVPVRSPRALAHVLRAPGQLGLGRAYVAGEMEVDDLDAVLRAARRRGRRRRSTGASSAADGSPRVARDGRCAAAAAAAAELRAAGATPLARARRARGAPPLRRLERVLRAGPRRVDDVLVRDLLARRRDTLEEAQDAKLELVCTKLGLRPASACSTSAAAGALRAARGGASTASTSPASRSPSRRRSWRSGRGGGGGPRRPQVEIRVADYRELPASRSTRSPRSAWSSTSAARTSTPTPRRWRGC